MRMQSADCGVLLQFGEISKDGASSINAHDSPRFHDLVALLWMRREECFDLFFLHSPRIHVFAGDDWIDRQEWFAFVLERRGDWSLEKAIQRLQVRQRSRRR